jgi:hypothetical protein
MIEPLLAITDPEKFSFAVDRYIGGRHGTQVGFTKPTGYYLERDRVYGVSIAFGTVEIFDAREFFKAVAADPPQGYVDCTDAWHWCYWVYGAGRERLGWFFGGTLVGTIIGYLCAICTRVV